MDTPGTGPRDRGPKLARDVVLIVVAGTALGLAYNQSMLLASDTRALTWVATERTTGVLGLPAVAATPATGTTPATVPAGSAVPEPTKLSATTAHDTVQNVVQAPRKPAAAKPAPAKSATPPASKSAAPASSAPTPVTPAPSAPAPAVVKPAVAAPAIPDTREPLEAKLDVVKALYDADGAVFVDARPAEDYAAGHIAGASSLPFDDVFKKPELAKQFADRGKPIVTYCDGGDCELSRDLAFTLIDQGHKKVLFFKDGLPGWKAGGGATHTGTQP